jgi:hypothetical protein
MHNAFNFALQYAIRRVQVNQNCLKLNGTYQLLIYADDISIMGGSVHTIKKNTEALVVACKDIGLEVNTGKTKYIVMFRDLNAGQILSTKFYSSSFKKWKSSNIGEKHSRIQIIFRKKLRAN